MSIVSAKNGGDLLSVAKLLADPERLARELERFETVRKQAEDAVKLVAPAQEILRLREIMAKEHADALRLKDEAKELARKIVDEARAKATEVMDAARSTIKEAEERIASIEARSKELNAMAQDAHRKVTLEAAAAVKRREELDAALAEASEAKAKADAARERADAELAKVKAAVMSLTDALRG